MQKKKKIKIIERIIFLTIILTIIVILCLAKKIFENDPIKSDTNNIKNYSMTKYTKYTEDINKISTYNIPLSEYINQQTSSYTIFITSTDNIITNLTEKIKIYFNQVPEENKNDLINFCNAYDEIENKYRLQCKYENNRMVLTNTYNIENIHSQNITTKNYEIVLPIDTNTKLSDYIEVLDNQNIQHEEVSSIE